MAPDGESEPLQQQRQKKDSGVRGQNGKNREWKLKKKRFISNVFGKVLMQNDASFQTWFVAATEYNNSFRTMLHQKVFTEKVKNDIKVHTWNYIAAV